MIDSVLNSVTKTLHATFGDNYHYYVEDIEQDLQTPCFTIEPLILTSRSINRKDYHKNFSIVLHYFTDDRKNKKKDSLIMAEKVLEAIEYIEIDNHLLRGEDMEYAITDDVLQIFITYNFWTEREEVVEDAMEILEQVESTVERKE